VLFQTANHRLNLWWSDLGLFSLSLTVGVKKYHCENQPKNSFDPVVRLERFESSNPKEKQKHRKVHAKP
jgi:hypothetical protein